MRFQQGAEVAIPTWRLALQMKKHLIFNLIFFAWFLALVVICGQPKTIDRFELLNVNTAALMTSFPILKLSSYVP
jgi:hypothetical protein